MCCVSWLLHCEPMQHYCTAFIIQVMYCESEDGGEQTVVVMRHPLIRQ